MFQLELCRFGKRSFRGGCFGPWVRGSGTAGAPRQAGASPKRHDGGRWHPGVPGARRVFWEHPVWHRAGPLVDGLRGGGDLARRPDPLQSERAGSNPPSARRFAR